MMDSFTQAFNQINKKYNYLVITIFAQYVPKKYGMVKFSNRTPILEDRILIEICASNDETSLVTVNYIYGVINDEVQKAAKLRFSKMSTYLISSNNCSFGDYSSKKLGS